MTEPTVSIPKRRNVALPLSGAALLVVLAAAAAGPAQAQGRGGLPDLAAPRAPDEPGVPDHPAADPGRVLETELAFARAAQDRGQWTAFAQYAADDAILFVPQAVKAHDWLRGRADPPAAARWQPHEVWSSCDGSLALTLGAWQRPDGSVGYFTTVWAQHGDRGDGYRWVIDQGDTLAEPLAAPQAVLQTVADCPGLATRTMSEAELEDFDAAALRSGALVAGSGSSADGTLAYRYAVQPSGAREFVAFVVRDGRIDEIIRSEVAAP